jgi:DNA invertase Pin-like site-specific DNA recombinase
MAKAAYVRVSSVEQNEARQIEALKNYEPDRWFVEKISGEDMERDQLKKLLDYVRPGDTIYVHDFSRLSRSLSDLLALVETLRTRGVTLVSNKEGFDTSTPTGKLMLAMIGAVNEFERVNMKERQAEGIEIAKREGKYKGRRATPRPARWAEYMELLRERKITKRELARMLKISRPTLDRLMAPDEQIRDAIYDAAEKWEDLR